MTRVYVCMKISEYPPAVVVPIGDIGLILVRVSILHYIHYFVYAAAKALASVRIYFNSPEPSLLVDAIGTKCVCRPKF